MDLKIFLPVAVSQFSGVTGAVCWVSVVNGLLAINLAIVSGCTVLLSMVQCVTYGVGGTCGIGDNCMGVIGVCVGHCVVVLVTSVVALLVCVMGHCLMCCLIGDRCRGVIDVCRSCCC